MSDYLHVSIDGHVAHLQLNDPGKLNAMGPAFWNDMPEVIEGINANRTVRALLITGAGRAFTAGLDVMAIMSNLPVDPAGGPPDGHRQAQLHDLIRKMQRAITAVERCRVPVVAAIHGYCLGGGVDLITACDIRVASPGAIFGVRETRIAMVADVGTLQRLPLLVGRAHARDLVLTGRDFDAVHALKIGLVTEVLEDDDTTLARGRAIAEEIAALPPLAVQGAKRVMNEADRAAVDRGLEYVATWNAAHLMTQDLGQAVTAMITKQTPEYEGR
ncbi:MAG: crotonase/enoyl-CoA hydratase family protein [Bradymonadia bacterium]